MKAAVQNLDDKIDALNEVEVPVEVEAKPIRTANKPSPSYRVADAQASEM